MISAGKRSVVLCGIAIMLLLAGCDTRHDEPVEWEQTIRAKGRITTIDYAARRLKFRSGFQIVTLRVKESVRHFNALKVGDRLDLIYHEAVIVALAPKNGGGAEELTKYRLSAGSGTQPGVALAKARQFTAEFVEFDYQSSIATFRKSDDSFPILVVPLGLRPFVRTLVPGDKIAVSIEEALSVTIKPDR